MQKKNQLGSREYTKFVNRYPLESHSPAIVLQPNLYRRAKVRPPHPYYRGKRDLKKLRGQSCDDGNEMRQQGIGVGAPLNPLPERCVVRTPMETIGDFIEP